MQEAKSPYRISVRALLLRPEEKKPVDMQIDAETAAAYGVSCSELPQVKGLLENRAGVLMLRYALHCVPTLECDRCLDAVNLPVEGTFDHVIVTETASEQNDAEYLLAPDSMLDLAEAVMTDLRLSMPTKVLCSPDCKGLCPVCGKNRNREDCGCGSADITLSYEA